MIFLLDIGNTNTHLGLANNRAVTRQTNIPTAAWSGQEAARLIEKFVGRGPIEGAALCSVVPPATASARQLVERRWHWTTLELSPQTVSGVKIRYPHPESIG